MIQPSPQSLSPESKRYGIIDVMDYFDTLVTQYEQGPEPCLFLRSLNGMAKHLSCSAVEIQASLILLQTQGYDYFMIDMDTPITFWHPDKLANLIATPTEASLT